jgi:hypothetical protein
MHVSGEWGDGVEWSGGRTEDDALCAAVVRRRDSAKAFLTRRILTDLSIVSLCIARTGPTTHPYTHLDFPPLDLHFMYLTTGLSMRAHKTNNQTQESPPRTLKSTPIVALASSSGNHCLSEKRRRRLLFPTDEFPISSSLTLMSSCGRVGCGIGAIVRCAC